MIYTLIPTFIYNISVTFNNMMTLYFWRHTAMRVGWRWPSDATRIGRWTKNQSTPVFVCVLRDRLTCHSLKAPMENLYKDHTKAARVFSNLTLSCQHQKVEHWTNSIHWLLEIQRPNRCSGSYCVRVSLLVNQISNNVEPFSRACLAVWFSWGTN